jgi:hypothetical protein
MGKLVLSGVWKAFSIWNLVCFGMLVSGSLLWFLAGSTQAGCEYAPCPPGYLCCGGECIEIGEPGPS